MASISKILKKELDQAIKNFSGTGEIYPSYELFPGRWIVAGNPYDMVKFSEFIKAQKEDAEWRYIPSTIAAHSPYLSYALEKSPDDAARLGLDFKGEDMQIPVLSNHNGEDLRKSKNIIFDIMQAYFVYPSVWRKQITPLLPPTKIRYVLDFGPGPGVASLTETHTSRSEIQVIRCTIPLGRKQLTQEILPVLS